MPEGPVLLGIDVERCSIERNEAGEGVDYSQPKDQMTDNLLGTDVERRCVERDEAGEGADCGRPMDQVYLPDTSGNTERCS